MTYTFKQASDQAVKAKKEVYDLVSVAEDFKDVKWFKIDLSVQEGLELMSDIESQRLSVQKVYDRPHKNGVKIHGVSFYWDKQAEAA